MCSGLDSSESDLDLWLTFAMSTCAQGVLQCEGFGVTGSQLDLLSLTPLSGAGCDRRQIGVAHWAASVALLQIVDN